MDRVQRKTDRRAPSTRSRSAGGQTLLPQPSSYWRVALLALGVAVVTFAVYRPVLSSGALFIDDHQYLVDNPLVQDPGWSSAGRFLREVLEPSTVGGYYQPLSMISLMLDYALGGRPNNLRVFHATSLALHVANTALIIVLLYLLFRRPWPAALVGLLFGVHPLHVESIAWIAERKTLLAAFFGLGCLILYVGYARRPRWPLYAACVAMYVLALLAKPTTTPLPVLMLLLDFWPLNRLNRRTVVEKAPFFALAAVAAVITYVSQNRTAGTGLPGEYPATDIPLVLCHNIVFYLWKIFWPMRLSPFYAFPVPLAISNPRILAGVIGTCLLIAALLISLRRTRAVATGWLFFFTAILPTMGIIGFTVVIAADRFTYLPMVGLLLPVAWLLSRWWADTDARRSPLPGHAAAVAIVLFAVIAESVVTRAGLDRWRDTESLYLYALESAPHAACLHANLAAALNEKKRFDEGILHCKAALSVRPDDPEAHNNLGGAFLEKGRFNEAVNEYQETLRLRPGYALAHHNLAIALHALGRTDEAIAEWNAALRLRPHYADADNNLGSALLEKGDVAGAIDHYRRALAIQPDHLEARYNLAAALAREGKVDEAIENCNALLRRRPNHAPSHYLLARLLVRENRLGEAVKEYQAALRIDPTHAAARRELNALQAKRAGTSQPATATTRP